MEFLEYLNRFEQTADIEQAKFFLTMLFSMVPVVELRGGLPFGVALGLRPIVAFWAAVIGNMLPIPFLIAFTRKIFAWMRHHIPVLDGMISRLEIRAVNKSNLVNRYKFWGLLFLVAVPLPGTGAWTGALVAVVANLRMRSALPAIFIGILIVGLIVLAVTFGVVSL